MWPLIKTPTEIKEILEGEPFTFEIPPSPYNYIRINGYIVAEHRFVWTKHNGKIPEDHHIHHLNGKKKITVLKT